MCLRGWFVRVDGYISRRWRACVGLYVGIIQWMTVGVLLCGRWCYTHRMDNNKVNSLEYCTLVHFLSSCTLPKYYFGGQLITYLTAFKRQILLTPLFLQRFSLLASFALKLTDEFSYLF